MQVLVSSFYKQGPQPQSRLRHQTFLFYWSRFKTLVSEC